jgi:hypothetical protein
MSELGLSFIRKKAGLGYIYFITNLSNSFTESKFKLARNSKIYTFENPLTGQKWQASPEKLTGVSLTLQAGESVIVRTSLAKKPMKIIPKMEEVKTSIFPNTSIQLSFLKGAPELPATQTLNQLDFWTNDTSTHRFWGTGKYSFNFDLNSTQIENSKVLHLGQLNDWAKVTINGVEIGKVWALPFQIQVPKGILKTSNHIEIEVTNLSANRIRDLDKRGIVWKNFHEINFVDIRYKPFDAAKWDIDPSGLKGELFFTNR